MEEALARIERANDGNHRNILRLSSVVDELDQHVEKLVRQEEGVERTTDRIRSLERAQQKEKNDVVFSDRTVLIDFLKDEVNLDQECRNDTQKTIEQLQREKNKLYSLINAHEDLVKVLQEEYEDTKRKYVLKETLAKRRMVSGSLYIQEKQRHHRTPRVEFKLTFPDGTSQTASFGSMSELYAFIEMNTSVDLSYTVVSFNNRPITSLPPHKSSLRVKNQ